MAQFLNLAMAAKMAGVKRGNVQDKIRQGYLSTFEGMIHVDELLRVFPAAKLENTEMIDFVDRTKEAALGKMQQNDDPERLLQQIGELRRMLAEDHHRNVTYTQIITDLSSRLLDMQKQCDKKDKVMLETVVNWLGHQMDQNAIR